MIKRFFIVLLFTGIFIPGCKTYTRIMTGNRATTDYRRIISDKLKENTYPDYLLVENADFKMRGDNSVNARITFYVEKDKKIFFAVKYLGFEVARGEVTPDSIRFINRLQREYYYGPVRDLRNYMPVGLDYETIQRFLYTGFYYDNQNKKDFARRFEQEGDTLTYNVVLNEGQKLSLLYNKHVMLDKLYLSDYIHHFLAEITIDRKEKEPSVLLINAVTGNSIKDIEVNIKDIKNKKYTRTDFKIGKNYTELERLF